MRAFLHRRPWIWIVVAFFILIGAWTALITIALNNQPAKVQIEEK
jgi:hypothetical protein